MKHEIYLHLLKTTFYHFVDETENKFINITKHTQKNANNTNYNHKDYLFIYAIDIIRW